MNTEIEVITNLSNKDVFRVAHKFTTLKGSEFNPLEIDFLFSFISEIQKDDERFKKYKITKDILQKKMKRRLEKARVAKLFDSLITKYISVSNDEEEKRYSIFDTLSYNKKHEYYEVSFSSEMKPFFLKIKPFTQGYLKDVFKCEGAYEKKLYLFLSQWLKVGKIKVETEWLMKELQVTKSYQNYADFKRKILNTAKRNFAKNDLSIRFDFSEKKKNRKVAELEFTIWEVVKSKKEEPTLIEADAEDESILIAPYIQKKIYLKNIEKSGTILQIRKEPHDTGAWKIYVEASDGRKLKVPMPYLDLKSMLASLQESNFTV